MNAPLVSVIIPVYNGARFLAEAMESVFKQTYASWELIVVDDGSTDTSTAIANSFPGVRCLSQANGGAAAARNRGLAAATGENVAFLDADDRWLPVKLQRQMDRLQLEPEVDGVVCHMSTFLEPETFWPESLKRSYYAGMPPAFLLSALLARRQVFARVGDFNPDYRVNEDSDWFFRARDAGVAIAIVAEVLLQRRIHGHNLSQTPPRLHEELVSIVRASLRHRQERKS